MFNQPAGKKCCKTEEGGPRGRCLGPGTTPSSIWDEGEKMLDPPSSGRARHKKVHACLFHVFGGFIFLLLCKLEPSIVIRSMKLAEQAWNS